MSREDMTEKIMLSISMLTSGKRPELEKSILSLQSLRDKVPSELIIVDTGCDAVSRTLIEKYATKIVDFTWCDDFSKARNAGLREAVGEWFLYLDDDEWFEDTEAIEHFFLDGSYKRYHYAFYIQRNYQDFAGKIYFENYVARMIERHVDTRYIYAIHEIFEHLQAPGCVLASYVHHYGYAYCDVAEKYAKVGRNLRLLWQEHEKDPDNLRHYTQMVQEYSALNENMESYKLSMEAIEKYLGRGKLNAQQVGYLNALFSNATDRLRETCCWQEVLERGQEFLGTGIVNPLTEALIYSDMGRACYQLEDYAQSLEYILKYIEAYSRQKKDANYYVSYHVGLNEHCFEKANLQSTVICGISAAIHCDALDEAGKLAESVAWDDGIAFIQKEFITKLADGLTVRDRKKAGKFVPIANAFLKRADMGETFGDEICGQLQNKNSGGKNMTVEQLEVLCQLESDSWLFRYLKLWWKQTENCKEWTVQEQKDWEDILRNPRQLLQHAETVDLWNVCPGKLLKFSYGAWEDAVEQFSIQCALEQLEQYVDEIFPKFWGEDSSLTNTARLCLIQRKMQADSISEEMIRELSAAYCDCCGRLYAGLYQEDAIERIDDRLPIPLQISLHLERVKEHLESSDTNGAVQELGNISRLHPGFGSYVKQWLELIRKRQTQEQEEFSQLAQGVLVQVKAMLQAGKKQEALPVLQQLHTLLPENEEIVQLMLEIK